MSARPTIRWDHKNVRQSMVTLRDNTPSATRDIVRIMVAAASRKAMDESIAKSYDTGRFARGFGRIHNSIAGETGNGTGMIPVLPLPDLQVGTVSELLGNRIIERRRWYENAWKSKERDAARLRASRNLSVEGRRYLRKLESELDRLDRALAELRKQEAILKATMGQPGVIVVLGKKTKSLYRISNIERVFPTEYISRATIRETSNGVEAVMEHREPHALIVNKRTGILTRAIANVHYETGNIIKRASHAAAGRLRARGRLAAAGVRVEGGV